jgi:protein translocase SecG subunit
MALFQSYLPFAQILVSFLIVACVLLQQRGTGLGGAFGGGGDGSFFATRRGIQQKLYLLTWVLGTMFLVLAILNLLF